MIFSRRNLMATSLAAFAASYLNFGEDSAFAQAALPGEDGSKLWLRYMPVEADAIAKYQTLRDALINVEGDSPTLKIIRDEASSALKSMLGNPVAINGRANSIIIGTPAASAAIRNLNLADALSKLGPEGYVIKTQGKDTLIASESEIGALYGVFHFLRLIQTRQSVDNLNIGEKPKILLRQMDHWDNPNGSIERGYAGRSLWNWAELPGTISPRYAQYARACASIGINGAVLNNVNADVRMLSPEYLAKVAAIANVFRPYGVKVYLSANFAAPMRLGGLTTADPLNPEVANWWKTKCDEIYKLIPDFGGFLVKANSEGQPGPKDYNRNHAEGANVLADAVAPHKGNIIWRTFIYDETVDPDRAKRAYIEFMALEGKFKPNVLVQIKNGAVDFMPREPFHPLFGALVKTPAMLEIQPTQEYLGQAKHLVYLGTMWEELLRSDTHAKGPGSTVGKVLEGKVHPQTLTGIAGVTNPGSDVNWCGHDFSQSNWYAFGRLAWDPELSAEAIAEEWTRQTWSNEASAVKTIVDMMMRSREIFVNYTMPIGLHHLIDGDHYAPAPQNNRASRIDWTATYYHKASPDGIGFDRSMKGNKAVDQYFPTVRDLFDNPATCPENYLLWFHRLPWDYKMKSGKTLWEELCEKYYSGAKDAEGLAKTWDALAGKIDPQRHKAVADRLKIQVADSAKWRDQILTYFKQFSGKEIVKQ